MDLNDSLDELCSVVASAADVCFKPWIHAVVFCDQANYMGKTNCSKEINKSEKIDFSMRIECRDREGKRFPEYDLELEIFRSGKELNLMINWIGVDARPMLWQGKCSIWMDGISGKRCAVPDDGIKIESFARRLRSLLSSY